MKIASNANQRPEYRVRINTHPHALDQVLRQALFNVDLIAVDLHHLRNCLVVCLYLRLANKALFAASNEYRRFSVR